MNKTVLLRGPFTTCSGYGVHARQVARWLFEKEDEWGLDISAELLPWGQTPWIVNPLAERGLIGRLLQASNNVKPFYDVTIQLQLPNEWNPKLGNFNIGITAGVETDRCNPAWVAAVNSMNLVIVPSLFTKQSIENSGQVTTQILIIPEAFIDEIVDPNVLAQSALDLGLTTDFNFLVFGQFTGNNPENDRKNLGYTIKWLCEAFHDKPEVGIVLKTNLSRNTKLDQNLVTNLLSKLLMEVKKGPGPKFYLLHGELSNEEVVGLYTHPKIKALVSFTRGEGFGLPMLEAAACGLPVIATNWSAHTEFLKHGKWCSIDCGLVPIHESRVDNQIFMPGVNWANPSESNAKYRVLKFYESPQIPKQWATDLKSKIISLYKFDEIAKHYNEALKACLAPKE